MSHSYVQHSINIVRCPFLQELEEQKSRVSLESKDSPFEKGEVEWIQQQIDTLTATLEDAKEVQQEILHETLLRASRQSLVETEFETIQDELAGMKNDLKELMEAQLRIEDDSEVINNSFSATLLFNNSNTNTAPETKGSLASVERQSPGGKRSEKSAASTLSDLSMVVNKASVRLSEPKNY